LEFVFFRATFFFGASCFSLTTTVTSGNACGVAAPDAGGDGSAAGAGCAASCAKAVVAASANMPAEEKSAIRFTLRPVWLFFSQPTKHYLEGQQRDGLNPDVSERCCNITPHRHRLKQRQWPELQKIGVARAKIHRGYCLADVHAVPRDQ
jgi:hypothetical protein